MSIAFGFLCLWAVIANIIAVFPSPKYRHWPAAFALLIVGIPLIVWVFRESTLIVSLVALVMWVFVLKWPLRFAGRWVLKQLRLT